jgi:hypothetical protein
VKSAGSSDVKTIVAEFEPVKRASIPTASLGEAREPGCEQEQRAGDGEDVPDPLLRQRASQTLSSDRAPPQLGVRPASRVGSR